MRFALIATSAAAVVAVPFAMAATAPQMSSDQFLAAVRCTAYEDVTRPDAETSVAEYKLNAEARRQPVGLAAQAQADASSIARQAVNIQTDHDAVMMHHRRAAACASAQLDGDAERSTAV